MELDIVIKLDNDKGLHQYLTEHSMWYRLLNRDKKNLDLLIKEYKSFKRENNMNKVNDTIDNIELITNIMKIVE